MTTTPEFTSTLKDRGGNWITGSVGGFQVQAKCYVKPSDDYGMPEDQRISKLWIALPGEPRVVLYDYDRGDLDKNHLKDEALAEIVAAVAKKIR